MRKVSSFLKEHWQLTSSVCAVIGFVVATLLGSGFLFKFGEVNRDQIRLETDLVSQLLKYESNIHELIPQYVVSRDKLSEDTPYEEVLQYQRLRSELGALFLSYNRNEARLSQLQERGAQFLIAGLTIPPRPPKVEVVPLPALPDGSIDESGVRIKIEHQEDHVVRAAENQLELLLGQYDDSFREAFYLQTCKAKQGRYCTFLATTRARSSVSRLLVPDVRELYKLGCDYEDPVACEALAFDDFHRTAYAATEQWMARSCALLSGDGCGFLGSLRVSRLLGERRNIQKGRENLESGCELQSKRSCYYLAIVHISGLVERDEVAARNRLEAACMLGLDEACKSLMEFDEFKACTPGSIHSPKGDVGIQIECVQQKNSRR